MNKPRKTPHIGIDLVEVSRCKSLLRKSNEHLLEKFFTKKEIEYCRHFKDAATHLAGTFAAKEAASKALGAVQFPFIELEVRRRKDGMPQIWRKGKLIPMSVSITHTRAIAAAVAIR